MSPFSRGVVIGIAMLPVFMLLDVARMRIKHRIQHPPSHRVRVTTPTGWVTYTTNGSRPTCPSEWRLVGDNQWERR